MDTNEHRESRAHAPATSDLQDSGPLRRTARRSGKKIRLWWDRDESARKRLRLRRGDDPSADTLGELSFQGVARLTNPDGIRQFEYEAIAQEGLHFEEGLFFRRAESRR